MMRKRTKLAVLGLLMSLAGASVATNLQAPSGDPEVVDMLSGISYSPNKTNLDSVMGLSDLILIAEDDSAEADPGIRIRALRAMGEYGLSPDKALASNTLRAGMTEFARAKAGTDLLFLRASLLSLAQLEGPNSVADLVPLLTHESRDIRAAAAQGLGITRSSAAAQPLRDRALIEQEAQVSLAIADALFELDLGNNP